jgi:hypothetical protein
MDETPIADDAEARRLAGLLLAGEARVGRLRERLTQYLQDREPLTLDELEVGFFPTGGRYDAREVARVAAEAGEDPWPLLSVDARGLRALFKRRPGVDAGPGLDARPNPAVVRPSPGEEAPAGRGRRSREGAAAGAPRR